MNPAGRLAAAIEVLAEVEGRRGPVSEALKDWGKAHRFAGSTDRSSIGNIVYDCLRWRSSSAFVMNDESPRGLVLGTIGRRFKAALGNNDIEFWMISNRIMPPIVAVLPIYVMFQNLKLLDTQIALISTYTAVNLPIVVWLTRDFFAGIPLDLEESAEIDGASKLRVFFTIALPLVRSGLAATFMLVLILAWNEYLLALFLSNANAQTMPVLLAVMLGQPMPSSVTFNVILSPAG